jgi:hypothetical protein
MDQAHWPIFMDISRQNLQASQIKYNPPKKKKKNQGMRRIEFATTVSKSVACIDHVKGIAENMKN